jgi:hypothetical protein
MVRGRMALSDGMFRRMTSKLSGNLLTSALLSLALGGASLPACSASSADNPSATGGAPSGGSRQSGGSGNTAGSGNTGTGAGVGSGGTGNPGSGGDGASGGGGGGGGGFDAGSDPNRNNVPGNQVCDRVTTIQCAGEAFCCSAPGRTFDACKATAMQACTNQLYLNAIASNPVAGYDQASATPIFAEYERRASICDPTVTAWGASTDGLRGLTKGTLSSGQSCSPGITNLTNKPLAAAYLASCMNAATTACYATALAWTCSPRANPGSKCFADTNCNDGIYCDNANFNLTGGTCKTRKADGDSCTTPNECQSLLCKHSQCVPVNQDNVFCLNTN